MALVNQREGVRWQQLCDAIAERPESLDAVELVIIADEVDAKKISISSLAIRRVEKIRETGVQVKLSVKWYDSQDDDPIQYRFLRVTDDLVMASKKYGKDIILIRRLSWGRIIGTSSSSASKGP